MILEKILTNHDLYDFINSIPDSGNMVIYIKHSLDYECVSNDI